MISTIDRPAQEMQGGFLLEHARQVANFAGTLVLGAAAVVSAAAAGVELFAAFDQTIEDGFVFDDETDV